MSKSVAVIMGGWSAERDVSLSSGREMARALRTRGRQVTEIDATSDLAGQLRAAAPDVVLNGLHGRGGEDGCVQGLLEVMRLPYTHSGVAASAIAMDKPLAKRLFAAAGLPVTGHLELTGAELETASLPYVVKPTNDGSSVGVTIVLTEADRDRVRAGWQKGHTRMVEDYIPGRELTVAVMGDRALTPIEITPNDTAFYDYTSKYAAGGSDHLIPPRLSAAVTDHLKDMALTAHNTLGCRGVTRSDFRYDPETGRMAILEINTQPGMTPTSLVPDAAAHDGLSYADVVEWMVEDASCPR